MSRYLRAARRLIAGFFRISNRDKIGKAPRMYATHYQRVDKDTGRAMARLGIRSPDNLYGQMKRAGVEDVNEYIKLLRHFKPRAQVWRRVRLWIANATGLYLSKPFHREYTRLMKERRIKQNVTLNERAEGINKAFREDVQK